MGVAAHSIPHSKEVHIAENLLVADVDAYTSSYLPAADPETQRALDAALARVRNYCGWHVSPVATETFTLRGSGFDFLVLPTLKIDTLTTVTEDGSDVDLSTIKTYTGEPGVLYRADYELWRRRCDYEIELDHGFAAADAADWREAVLSLIAQTAEAVESGRVAPMLSKEVDDTDVHWSGLHMAIENWPLDKSVLSKYRLFYFA